MRFYKWEETYFFDINKYGTLCFILDYKKHNCPPLKFWMQVIPRANNKKGMMFGINLFFNRQFIVTI